jgi:myo-inositol catabolism protein IolS
MMTNQQTVPFAPLPPDDRMLNPLVLGGTVFGADPYIGARADDLWATMEAALSYGINHFDTASGYGDGASERLIGQFLAGRRDQVFIASKASTEHISAAAMLDEIDQSLKRLQTDYIDLYYIHWPRKGHDLRPWMEGLETARQQGKIKAVGVSNFSVEQMAQVAEVGKINAHQLSYSLLWRFAEADIIPYCRTNGVAVVTYSSIAQGILTGKFPRNPQFEPGDSRGRTVHFDSDVWPHVYEAVEHFKKVAQEANRSLTHLAIRWVLHQPSVHSAVVSARKPQQLAHNVEALHGAIRDAIFERLTMISDQVMKHIPNTGNVYRYYP